MSEESVDEWRPAASVAATSSYRQDTVLKSPSAVAQARASCKLDTLNTSILYQAFEKCLKLRRVRKGAASFQFHTFC